MPITLTMEAQALKDAFRDYLVKKDIKDIKKQAVEWQMFWNFLIKRTDKL